MFEFIDKIKDKYRQNRVEKLLNVQKSLSEIEDRIEELSKAQPHKYIRKEPDGKGGFNYIYDEPKLLDNHNEFTTINKGKLPENYRFKEKTGDYFNPIFIPIINQKEKIEVNEILKDLLGNPEPSSYVSVFGGKYGQPKTGGYFSLQTTAKNIVDRQWVYNSKDVSNIIKELEEAGFRCDLREDGYSAPRIKCVHIKTEKYLKELTEKRDDKFKDVPTVFMRFGKSPKGGKSMNYRDNEPELGVSVFEAKISPDGDYRIVNANHVMAASHSVLASRPIYIIEGSKVGFGADGEPVVKVKKELSLNEYLKSLKKSENQDYISELAQLKLQRNKLLKSEQSLQKEDPLFKSMYDHMRFESTYKEVTKGYRQGQIDLDRCDEILKAINNDKKVKYSDNIVFNNEGKILLLKRSELDKTFPGMYTIPGGHVDAGEDHRTAAIRELQEESRLTPDKDSQFTKVGEYEDDKVCIEYFLSYVDNGNDTLCLQSEEAWQYEWVDPRELDKYEFPLNMKQNIQKMLFPNREIVQKLGKAFKSGKITREKFIQAVDVLSKSQSHKYISKKPDGKGGWEYKYEDKKEKTKLKKVLKSVESEIVKLKYEHGYCFDKDGNEIFNHTSHQERSIDLSAFESKLKNNIFTHNHPGNNEPSIYDIDICLFSQMKEMRSVSLDSQYGKGTYVMKNDLTEPFQMKDHVEELNKSYEDWYDNKQHTHKNGWIDVFKLSSFFEGIKNSVHFSFEKDNGEIIQL